ncbi:MAG: sigma 54-interacting transcriptional regulator [Pseudomonadota bacterium]
MTTIKAYNIIVIEPDPSRRNYLRMQISDSGDRAVCFEKEATCLDNLALLEPDLLILGLLPSERISRFLYAAKYIDVRLPILVMSAEPAAQAFIRVNGFPNTMSISPAISPDALNEVIGQFRDRRIDTPDQEGDRNWPIIVGSDPEIVKLKKAIFEIARSDEALLVEGECGTGKDLVARAVHFWSTRRRRAFVKVDSGAITREILQNDLSMWFERGEEVLKQAVGENDRDPAPPGPTFFFDEIGRIPLTFQGALLRLFEQRGGGGNGPFSGSACIRIIASTSENLAGLVETGKFRKDLFYRLNVYRIRIPPLRERSNDIPLLVDFFIDKYCRQLGKGHYRFPPKARSLYAEYDWPGNVRELENMVKSSVVVGDENGYIESLCRCHPNRKSGPVSPKNDGVYPLVDFEEIKPYVADLNRISLKDICGEFITRAEKKLMKKALDSTNWNRKKAAGLLNISYKSLLNKIKEYNLTV